MKIISGEFRKTIGNKYLLAFFAILFFANAILCIVYSSSIENELPSNIVRDFFDLYIESPERITSEYNDLKKIEEEQNELRLRELQLGNYEYHPSEIPNRYVPDGYSDLQLFDEVFEQVETIRKYPTTVQTVIDRAEEYLSEFDTLDSMRDTYAYRYQLRVIDKYNAVKTRVKLGFEYTRGFERYFAYNIDNYFILALLLITATIMFHQDKASGFIDIIRTTKSGCCRSAKAKLTILVAITIVVVIIFNLETWLIIGTRIGYSSFFNAIQMVRPYILCPYVITVGEYFLISILIKILSFVLVAVIISLLSAIAKDYAVAYICSLVLLLSNYLCYILPTISADSPWKKLNFFSITSVSPLFTRYRALNLLGNVIDYASFVPLLFIIITIVLSTLLILEYGIRESGRINVHPRNHNKIFSRVSNKKKTDVAYTLSLFASEIYKTLIASRYIVVVLFLLILKMIISYESYKPEESYSDNVYHEYMTELSGKIDDSKRQYLIEERCRIDTAIAARENMRQAYGNGEISIQEYQEYLKEYNYAYSRNEPLRVVEKHAAYIDEKAESGVDAWFIYDTGWKKIILSGFDITIYILFLFIFSSSFSGEYKTNSSTGNFIKILKASKCGRWQTFFSKFKSVLALTFVAELIWNAIDIAFVFSFYDMPMFNAPIQSIEAMSNSGLDITLKGGLIIFYLIRLTSGLIMATSTCAFSELLRNNVFAMAIISAVTFLPSVMRRTGLVNTKLFDFERLFCGMTIFLDGNVAFVVNIFLYTIMAVFLSVIAARTYCN